MTAKNIAGTPGPWIVMDQARIEGLDLRGLKSIAHVSDSAAGGITTIVAEIVGPDDAALIAAGPALLEALKTLLLAVDVDRVPGIGLATDAARAAINQAEGKS